MIDLHVENKIKIKNKKKYIDSYNTKWKKKNDWSARWKQNKNKKQKKYIDSYRRKKMIDVHVINKKNKERI